MILSYENELRVMISGMVGVIGKDGYFIGSNILWAFEPQYLYNTLQDWEKADKVKFDQELKKAIEDDIEDIKKDMLESFVNRGDILNCIFDLYKTSNFIALIPLVLSQVDGIVKEMTKGFSGLYQIKDGSPKFLKSEIYVHFVSNAVQLDINDRNNCELFEANVEDYSKFNRHAILHGESTKYATERNAIKSLALLQFISEVYHANSY